MRASAANTALVIIGSLLVIMAPVWLGIVAPALKVVAGDFDYVYFYEGTLNLTAASQNALPVALKQVVLSRADLSSPKVSAVREQLNLYNKSTLANLDRAVHFLAMDRKTGELTKSRGCDAATGYYIVFPFNSPKTSVPVWIQRARAAVKAKFVKQDKIGGVSVYRYDLDYHNLPCAPPPGFGATVKAGDIGGLEMPPDTVLQATYSATGKASYFVEPVMGSIVDIRNVVDVVNIKVQGPGFLAINAVYRLNYSLNKYSIGVATTFAKEEISKLRLQFVYMPMGLFLLGVALGLIGYFVGTKSASEETNPNEDTKPNEDARSDIDADSADEKTGGMEEESNKEG